MSELLTEEEKIPKEPPEGTFRSSTQIVPPFQVIVILLVFSVAITPCNTRMDIDFDDEDQIEEVVISPTTFAIQRRRNERSYFLNSFQAPCQFNTMCTCQYMRSAKPKPNSTRVNSNNNVERWSSPFFETNDASATSSSPISKHQQPYYVIDQIECENVPFYYIPDFVVSRYVSRVSIVGSNILRLESDLWSNIQQSDQPLFLHSLRLMDDEIYTLHENTFRSSMFTTLRSLDLSYNKLSVLPMTSLNILPQLRWLNLHGNQIQTLESQSQNHHQLRSLRTLFIGENNLVQLGTELPVQFPALVHFNGDGNSFRSIKAESFPPNLTSLSLNDNLISSVPDNLLRQTPHLQRLSMRNNYLDTFPIVDQSRSVSKILKVLDLGQNFIYNPSQVISQNDNKNIDISNNVTRLHTESLNLDYNFMKTIGDALFGESTPHLRNIYCAHNKIVNISTFAFKEIKDTLELLDLTDNELEKTPLALKHTTRMKYLYLASNKLTNLDKFIFSELCSNSLTLLDVERNNLRHFPHEALRNCFNLSHLNVGYNEIEILNPIDLKWASNLKTLIMKNNHITSLNKYTFKHCSTLRHLSFSFNHLQFISKYAFKGIPSDTLQTLEFSFSLNTKYSRFLTKQNSSLQILHNVGWLTLDNNHLTKLDSTSLYNFGKLQYLNLESNQLSNIPPQFLHQNVHKLLTEVRLSHNKIMKISKEAFTQLPKLEIISMTGNQILQVDSNSFSEMPNLKQIILDNNKMTRLEEMTFIHLPSLERISLRKNFIREFSFSMFHNCSNQLSIDVSHNHIQHLINTNTFSKQSFFVMSPTIHVRRLDFDHNEITHISDQFFEPLSTSLRHLSITFNKLSSIDDNSLYGLSQLNFLNVSNNEINSLQPSSVSELLRLQFFDCSNNKISMLHFGQFKNLHHLTWMNLAKNRLRSLPRDTFKSTSIEFMDLSNNDFGALPTSSLIQISRTIRHLNLSNNRIEHIDGAMFTQSPFLTSLSLANNRLTIIPDNTFVGLNNLIHLDLSFNHVDIDFKETFNFIRNVKILNLKSNKLKHFPEIHSKELLKLDLSENEIEISENDRMTVLPSLQMLNISDNNFKTTLNWHAFPSLTSLDVSSNPITVLTKQNFFGLQKLKFLRVQSLKLLKRFDANSLFPLLHLEEISIQSWPSIEKFKFRLGSIVSSISSLKKLAATIMESNGVLSDQLMGSFSPKLTEIELSGQISEISEQAFQGLSSYELLFRLHNTEVQKISSQVFQTLTDNVINLSLDLRGNQFRGMSFDSNYGKDSKSFGSVLIKGGMALQDNPWRCTCKNLWIGRWLKRWMEESLHLHQKSIQQSENIQSIVRSVKCEFEKEGAPKKDSTNAQPYKSSHSHSLVSLSENREVQEQCYEFATTPYSGKDESGDAMMVITHSLKQELNNPIYPILSLSEDDGDIKKRERQISHGGSGDGLHGFQNLNFQVSQSLKVKFSQQYMTLLFHVTISFHITAYYVNIQRS